MSPQQEAPEAWGCRMLRKLNWETEVVGQRELKTSVWTVHGGRRGSGAMRVSLRTAYMSGTSEEKTRSSMSHMHTTQ